MTSGSTREFLALCAIAQHFGRPGTPTDQAWIESLNGHIKIENPHLLAITDPATLRAELAVVREHYNTPVSATSPPTTNTKDAASRSAKPAKQASNKPGSSALPGTEQNEKIRLPRDPPMLFDSPRISIAKSETPQSVALGRGVLVKAPRRASARPHAAHDMTYRRNP
ncbi:MAG: integrase core domain-containing protein [Microthrixaceae bacterium]